MQPALKISVPLKRGFGGLCGFFCGFACGSFFLLLACGSNALVELINAAGRVDKLLLTGEQRMALRTNFYSDLRQRRTGRKGSATGTVYLGFGEPFGMNLLFHSHHIVSDGARGAASRSRRNPGRAGSVVFI